MISIKRIHHIAIICSDYERSKHFYTAVLGLTLLNEIYRAERDSWKADLGIGNDYCIELFSFPNPPQRLSYPEALGLRHLAFCVDDVEAEVAKLQAAGIAVEPIRVDAHTGKKCVFFPDPDGLPIELYEA
ncbi:MAG: VOC family protein [Chloroflexota bacterium]